MSRIAQHYAARTHKKNPIEQSGRQTVSIHVRQKWGDGAKGLCKGYNPLTAIRPHLGVQYYQRAIKHVLSMGDTLYRFMIFGDSPEWAKANLLALIPASIPVEIVPPSESQVWDNFFSISQCPVHILSNSSFCYCAALLSDARIVIAPANYCHDTSLNQSGFPSHWIRL